MLRNPYCWDTTFGRWVSDYTVRRLAQDLGITSHSVYDWISGYRIPRGYRAQQIVELSASRVTIDDVYSHRVEVDERLGSIAH